MITDGRAHVSPGHDHREDRDFDTDPELWAYHQRTTYFHHKPVATTAGGGQAPDAGRLL